MRKLLNRKIVEQKGICAICQKPLKEYGDVVPDHKGPKGMGGARRDDHPDNIQAVHRPCNSSGELRLSECVLQNLHKQVPLNIGAASARSFIFGDFTGPV
jgi:hypothetical protein